ncbi:MAG: response regulator [Planctomycetes bacterium]|nr:response regulator [Planctomycetota bacterium]
MVLLVEPEPGARETLVRNLKSVDVEVRSATSIRQMLEAMADRIPDVLLLNLGLEGMESEVIVSMIHMVAPDTRIVAYSPKSDPKDAAAVEGGVFFYAAGGDESYVAAAIQAALQKRRR